MIEATRRRSSITSRSAAAVLTVGFFAGLIAAAPSPTAMASNQRPCVTEGEFNQTHPGMRRSRVSSIFDTPGERLWIKHRKGHQFVKVAYAPCADYGYVEITYRDRRFWKVVAQF